MKEWCQAIFWNSEWGILNADFGIKSKGLGFRIQDFGFSARGKGKEKRQIKNNTRQTTPFFFYPGKNNSSWKIAGWKPPCLHFYLFSMILFFWRRGREKYKFEVRGKKLEVKRVGFIELLTSHFSLLISFFGGEGERNTSLRLEVRS